jgi:uncharacterized protein DUF4019
LLFSVADAKSDNEKIKPEDAAISSAQKWLKIVDSEKYGEAWDKAAAYMKGAVSKENFTSSLQGVRKPLGKVLKRSLLSSTYTSTLPGAPDGEYVIIQFKTEFENKKEAVETVTPRKEKDDRWKVSGYYIR